MAHYLDLHSHVLPALDDGARDAGQSEHMLALLGRLGFSEVCATPHQKAEQYLPSGEAIATAYEGLAARNTAPRLLLGAENYWDEVFFARSQAGTVPCYTGGKAFLIEIPPHLVPPRFEEHLFAQRARGLLPVLAHPERYAPLVRNLSRLSELRRTAALVVDLGALEGSHGEAHARAARTLVLEGLAHAVASDVHSPADVQIAAGGIDWLFRKCGADAAKRLLEDHPRRILQGELPE
jgi:protein-tyrosine phosphatase